MRVVTVRGWSKEYKKMWESPTVNFATSELLMNDGEWYMVDKLLMPTGLKDKNGVEIYEGDIIHLRFHEAPDGESFENGLVKWNEQGAGFKWYSGDAADMNNYWLTHADTKYRKVIGNIYENPDMLASNQTKGENRE